jgi:hypothetical protein
MIGRDLFNSPCRICRRPTIHRTRTRHPERKSKSEGHCGSYRAGGERSNLQIPTSTQALLSTSTHSNGFCIIRVCISSSSSYSLSQPTPPNHSAQSQNRLWVYFPRSLDEESGQICAARLAHCNLRALETRKLFFFARSREVRQPVIPCTGALRRLTSRNSSGNSPLCRVVISTGV